MLLYTIKGFTPLLQGKNRTLRKEKKNVRNYSDVIDVTFFLFTMINGNIIIAITANPSLSDVEKHAALGGGLFLFCSYHAFRIQIPNSATFCPCATIDNSIN